MTLGGHWFARNTGIKLRCGIDIGEPRMLATRIGIQSKRQFQLALGIVGKPCVAVSVRNQQVQTRTIFACANQVLEYLLSFVITLELKQRASKQVGSVSTCLK